MGFSLAWVRFSPSPVTTYASRRRLHRHGLSTCVVTVLKFGHINVFFCYLRFERLYMYEHFRDCSTITPSRLLRKLSTFKSDKRVFNFRESWYNVVHIKYYANIHEIKNTRFLILTGILIIDFETSQARSLQQQIITSCMTMVATDLGGNSQYKRQ